MLSKIHSFIIHYGDLYSAPSRLLLRSAPDPCTAKEKSFDARVKCVRKNPGEQSLRSWGAIFKNPGEQSRKPCNPVEEIFALGTISLISTALLYPEVLILLPGGL